ncbi:MULTISPECIES: ABC transporter ATP-binding protein [Agrobacterium]|uniref:dipeptide ABC transporter ATP-binding protein n=1 Tax=Agrobacterium TaxID=357 RepID=UPI000DBFD9C0|nr:MULTISPECIES: ABC transporter ATP-binding protein [Agrobacterium]MDH0873330.1 ABC transporter ATP-binding protein [Agrobacterium pusense]MDH1267574.1 ABC transporter ATP-binding protein [Agrobacterium pusense]RAL99427.1 ABC transporter ATP-binding protein [Agrobacterium sp. MS2]
MSGVPTSVELPLLKIEGLDVAFASPEGDKLILKDVDFELRPNEILGIVGETGAGKSILARAMIDLFPSGVRRTSGEVFLRGNAISQFREADRRAMRGGEIALIGTNAKALLDPVEMVGNQVVRVLRSHRRLSKAEAWQQAVELLASVGIVDPEQRARAYPHELSGGMAQRVVIAMALITKPKIVLADDATLGLDATVSVQVLDMLVERARTLGVSIVIITHDLGIIAHYCDRVAIMRQGRIEEMRDTAGFLADPRTSYSRELLEAAKARPVPALRPTGRDEATLLEVRNLVKIFPGSRPGETVRAVDHVSFSVRRGETLALVGESGSGKTTIGQCLVRLLQSTSGQIVFDGEDVTQWPETRFRKLRRRVQMVFQEPYVALNPRWRVRHLIDEPLRMLERMSTEERLKRVHHVLDLVNLPSRHAEFFPHELTAGEQKRIGIARALVTEPDFVIFDEPTTALDIRVRAQIIDLVRDLQSRMGLSALFITHDLNSVRSLAHDVAVMNRGRIVETGTMEDVFRQPQDPYTKKLLSAELAVEHVAAAQGITPVWKETTR